MDKARVVLARALADARREGYAEAIVDVERAVLSADSFEGFYRWLAEEALRVPRVPG